MINKDTDVFFDEMKLFLTTKHFITTLSVRKK